MNPTKDQIIEALRIFKTRRDNLLHEDIDAFQHNLERFMAFCRTNPMIQKVIHPSVEKTTATVAEWWAESCQRNSSLVLPNDPDEEFGLLYKVMDFVVTEPRQVYQLGLAQGKRKLSDSTELFRSMIVRPFVEELTHRLGKAAEMVSPDERALQAVPLNRITSLNQTRIFLSHKSVDKPIVERYFRALQTAGFSPWMDSADMPAGSNLERDLFGGFEASCAAVFFITENFKDENYLASEVDYARMQLREKHKKFVIIILRYSKAADIPKLLKPYVYKDVENDLEGFIEILRALPVELGSTRWKEHVVD